MIWLALVLALLHFLQVSGLECYHMNKYGVSNLVTCRGYCASISAVVASNNLAEVNYCVPERRCLAELESRQLADMGMLICRGLIDSAEAGAITRCKAAVCQSDGCNNYNFRSNTRLNDCRIHQCSNAECHNPEETMTTIAPLISSTFATQTTPPRTPQPKVPTQPRVHTTRPPVRPTRPPVRPTPKRASTPLVVFDTTEPTTTAYNEVTTKTAEETPESDQPRKSVTQPEVSTRTEEETSKTENPTTEGKQPTTESEEKQPTTRTGTPAATTDESSATAEERSLTAEESSATAEESSATAEESAVTAEESSATAEESSVTTEESSVTTEKSSVTTEEYPLTPEKDDTVTSDQPTLGPFATLTRGGPLQPTFHTETESSVPPSAPDITTDSRESTTDNRFKTTPEFEVFSTTETEKIPATEERRSRTTEEERTTPFRTTRMRNNIETTAGPVESNKEYFNDGYLSNNTLKITDKKSVIDDNSSSFRYYLSLSLLISVICFVVL